MTELNLATAAFLMINIVFGGIRVARGPTRADRMLGAQFLTTAAVAIFLLLAEALGKAPLRNLSLAFVALAALTTIAFTQVYGRAKKGSP